jgi:hypothetical protein
MKTLIHSFFIFLTIILTNNVVFSDDPPPDPGFEIKITNNSGQSIYARLYPVSAIFNGRHNSSIPPKFTLNSFFENIPRNGPGTQLPLLYLVGFDKYALNNRGYLTSYFEIPSTSIYNPAWLDHNTSGSGLGVDALFGYGLYNLEFYYYDAENEEMHLINNSPILLDYRDFTYPYDNNYFGMVNDLLYYYKFNKYIWNNL